MDHVGQGARGAERQVGRHAAAAVGSHGQLHVHVSGGIGAGKRLAGARATRAAALPFSCTVQYTLVEAEGCAGAREQGVTGARGAAEAALPCMAGWAGVAHGVRTNGQGLARCLYGSWAWVPGYHNGENATAVLSY